MKVKCPICQREFLGKFNELYWHISFHLVSAHSTGPKEAEELSKKSLLASLPKRVGKILAR